VVPIKESVKAGGNYNPLIPLQEEEIGYADYYLSATDFAANGLFCFFDLPAGSYELAIDAEGREPYSRTYKVIPGQYLNAVIIELVKKAADSR
jgi:hypothetical protein